MIVNTLLGGLVQSIVNLHYCGLITTSVTIVRGGKYRHDALIVLPLVPFHDELMCSRNKVQSINVSELLRNVLPEGVPSSARRYAPATSVIRVGPDQVAHRSLVGYLLHSVQVSGMVKSIDRGGESAVQAEDAVLHDGCHGEIIEGIREVLPYVGVTIFSEAFVVESISIVSM